ncbi:MAG: glycoside hydrolase family 88 protein [Flavisolibacter sp.]
MRFLFIITLFASLYAQAQPQRYAEAVAETAMKIWPDSFTLKGDKYAKWRYDQGVILKGMEGLWQATGDGRWFRYIQKSMDFYVADDGSIKGYKHDEYNIDHINNGKLLLMLYEVTLKDKYRKAADRLRDQLRTHPRTTEGGFWHKKIYEQQMWLDGLYMGQPFYAQYAKLFHDDTAFNDITRQFVLMEKHARDPKTGLLYHGWDASRQQQWADKTTGLSPNFWGRALGWYGMAMVDVLDYFPENHPGRDSITAILNRFAEAVVRVQDPASGLWYDVPNKPEEPKNYFEASASSMLVYTLAKAVRKGYLPSSYIYNAWKGFEGITERFIKTENGQTNLHGTVAVSGLGGKPYRDGSFDYYMSEPVVVNDPKGMGAFINAANEIALSQTQKTGMGLRVVLDRYFNNEWKKDATGTNIRYHYTWEDRANSGFSTLGHIFTTYGVETANLDAAPNATNLSGADIYVIVDPDTKKETEEPHAITPTHAKQIAEWVKAGGVLVLLGNDAGNADLQGLNVLSSQFGIHFNGDNFNMVKNDVFEQGAVTIPAGLALFPHAKKPFIKELATLQVQDPAQQTLQKDGNTIMAVTPFGKGTVFALGDPWLYNEYVDGRKLPAEYDNYTAATDLVQWLIAKARKHEDVNNIEP